jgi:hypothetical protein
MGRLQRFNFAYAGLRREGRATAFSRRAGILGGSGAVPDRRNTAWGLSIPARRESSGTGKPKVKPLSPKKHRPIMVLTATAHKSYYAQARGLCYGARLICQPGQNSLR